MSAALALQAAMVAALKADAGVAALVGARVYDRVPEAADYPLLELGEVQSLADGHDCSADAAEIYVTWHAWSRDQATGATPAARPTAARLAEAARAALHGASLSLGDDWSLADLAHRDTRIFREADGLTVHAVSTYRAFVDPADAP